MYSLGGKMASCCFRRVTILRARSSVILFLAGRSCYVMLRDATSFLSAVLQ